MQLKKAKFILIAVLLLFTFFFSNDFGLIDVEKTSIITAFAIDKDSDGYVVCAQVAVHESTDANAENKKASLSGKGKTVGEAIKNIGDNSGWFPKLAFCNLILLGNSLAEDNVVNVLDYFAKTLRLQDSALVALSEHSAKELLEIGTPLDNISSFALQKIMFKTPGFDKDVAPTDVKSFCSGHYSLSASSYMPLVKVISAQDGSSKINLEKEKSEQSASSGAQSTASTGGGGSTGSGSSGGGGSGGGGSGGGAKKTGENMLFDARTTALFKDGKKVGELDSDLTLAFNALNYSMSGTTLPVYDVAFGQKTVNYLLTILDDSRSVNVKATDQQLTVDVLLSLYCKISDVDTDYSDQALSQNQPLPTPLVNAVTDKLTSEIKELFLTATNTGCDFLKIKEKLYRHNFSQYSRYKDDYLQQMKLNVRVDVHGQT